MTNFENSKKENLENPSAAEVGVQERLLSAMERKLQTDKENAKSKTGDSFLSAEREITDWFEKETSSIKKSAGGEATFEEARCAVLDDVMRNPEKFVDAYPEMVLQSLKNLIYTYNEKLRSRGLKVFNKQRQLKSFNMPSNQKDIDSFAVEQKKTKEQFRKALEPFRKALADDVIDNILKREAERLNKQNFII